MNAESTLQEIKTLGMLAVIRGPSAELTLKMVDALVAGGVYGIEITYSTPEAEEVVRQLNRRHGNHILLGMGTLTEPSQVKRAKDSGARFLVSPICTPALVKAMIASNLLVMAGAFTPTEIFQAYQLGSHIVKVFPGSLAGPAYIRALKGPFPYIRMMPTGGVNAANLGEWFAAGVEAIGAGSELCPPQLAKEGRFAEITRRAEEFISAVKAARQGLS